MQVYDEKRYCILCRDELVDIPKNINIHPIPCQEEMDNYIPEDAPELFTEFFQRLTGLKISPIQEQMFLYMEGQSNQFVSSRMIGKTTLLLVYIIYKAIETGEQYGAVFHNRQMENHSNRLFKEYLFRLNDDEKTKLDIHVEWSPYSNRVKLYARKDPKADTFINMEIRQFFGLSQHERDSIHTNFTQWKNIKSRYSRGVWHMIFDPLY